MYWYLETVGFYIEPPHSKNRNAKRKKKKKCSLIKDIVLYGLYLQIFMYRYLIV